MSQAADYILSSGLSGTGYRTEDQSIIDAILSMNSGAVDPPATFGFMAFADTSVTPNELKFRNPGDTAFIKWAELTATTIKLFSEGAAVVSLANTDAWTANQLIDVAGAAAIMTVASDRNTGIAASYDFVAHNSANADIIGASLDMRVVVNTAAAENCDLELNVLRAGVPVKRMTLDNGVSIVGTLDADTITQGGTAVASLIETAISSIDEDPTSAIAVAVPADVTAGDMNTFTGAAASTWTINSGTAKELYPVLNDGTADITFAPGVGVTIAEGGLTLAPGKTCSIYYRTATRVFIFGQNV